MIIPNIWKLEKNVPNHRPVIIHTPRPYTASQGVWNGLIKIDDVLWGWAFAWAAFETSGLRSNVKVNLWISRIISFNFPTTKTNLSHPLWKTYKEPTGKIIFEQHSGGVAHDVCILKHLSDIFCWSVAPFRVVHLLYNATEIAKLSRDYFPMGLPQMGWISRNPPDRDGTI